MYAPLVFVIKRDPQDILIKHSRDYDIAEKRVRKLGMSVTDSPKL